MAHVREVERKTGRAYEVRWRDGGKFRQRSFTVKREAERFALTVENEQHAGNSTAPLVKNTKTLRQVADEAMNADRPNRKQKTMDAYEVAYRVHIYPALGGRRISTITAADVQQFIAQLRAKPKANGKERSETSVLGTYKALAKVFSYAMKHRLITYNPCVAVDKPRADTQEARFLSPAEVERLAAALDPQPPYSRGVHRSPGRRAGRAPRP